MRNHGAVPAYVLGENRALFRRLDSAIRHRLYTGVEFLALRGLHAKAIATATGISVWQVYQMCRQMKIRLRDYRDGRGPVGAAVYSAGRKKARGK